MSGLSADEAAALADELESGFRNSIISFWFPRALDPAGGYHVCWDRRGRRTRDERGSLSQARMLYVFARTARFGYRTDLMLDAAEHGFRYLRDVLWDDEHGGFGWSFTDPRKVTYGNAFALFGLAEYIRAGGGDDVRALAIRTLDALETHAHDDAHGGYAELFAPDWSPVGPRDTSPLDMRPPTDKLLNTQMHMMEAMVAAHRVNLDARAKTRAIELVEVIASRAVRGRFGAPLTDAWGADWRARKLDRTVRYGHLIEGAWLLVDSADAVGAHQDAARATADRLAAYVQQYGTDPETGGIWHSGNLGRTAGDRRYEWWAQAEALMAYTWRWTESFDTADADRLRRVWSFIRNHVEDRVVGEWHDELDTARNGQGPKGGAWKDGYHPTRALLDSATRLRKLDRSPNR
jgi:cellobiose epimerase